jgi:hypothetical protein
MLLYEKLKESNNIILFSQINVNAGIVQLVIPAQAGIQTEIEIGKLNAVIRKIKGKQ